MIGTGAHYSASAADLWGTARKQKPLPTSHLGTMAGYDQAHDPGQCIPAVFVPYGMNCWVAQTEDTEQKGIAPYYYQDDVIQGFRGSHWIVGSMTQDYGSFTLMPMGDTLITDVLARGSRFSHDVETATPYYYSVRLDDYGILAEMTATSRAALFRFTYDRAGDVYLSVNANSDECQGTVAYDSLTHQITGSNPVHRIYQGAGQPAGYAGHFAVTFGKEPLSGGTYQGERPQQTGAYVRLHVEAGETLLIKAASSFTSIEGALHNMQAEIPGWDFDGVQRQLRQTWQQRLSRIETQSTDTALLRSFYTALYHASVLPRTIGDADGTYPSFDGGKELQHVTADGEYYDDYSLWDTYRAMHPLIALLEPAREARMVQSMLDKYRQGGWLPIFPCWNSYTSEMIGDHCCSLVADAWAKGIRGFDAALASEALLRNAFLQPASYTDYEQGKGRRALQSYRQLGYIPVEDEVLEAYHKREQTSRTLEYAYDDYCLLQFLQSLIAEGRSISIPEGLDMTIDDILADLARRASSYVNVYNPQLGWVDGRHADGTWVGGDPYAFQSYICEGKPCHYTFYVPHDVDGLISLMGGRDAFVARLDTLFDQDIYWHGNEPCHQIAYLYDYAGMPGKTQQRIREIMQREYQPEADGLAGNDDAGQMSAWYIFSAMGFYPVCPGHPEGMYAIGLPRFDRMTLHLDNGRDFSIVVNRAPAEPSHIAAMRLNGRSLTEPFLTHADILEGGTLQVDMDVDQ